MEHFCHEYKHLRKWSKYDFEISELYCGFVFQRIMPKRNELVLDLGCGNGRFSVAIAKSGAYSVALDINKSMLRAALAKVEKEKVKQRVEVILGSAQNLPFREESFDKVLSLQTLWYVPKYEKVVQEILRTTKPDGKILIDHLTLLDLRSFLNGVIYKLISGLLRRRIFYILRRFLVPVFPRKAKQLMAPFKGNSILVFSMYQNKVQNMPRTPAKRLFIECTKTSEDCLLTHARANTL